MIDVTRSGALALVLILGAALPAAADPEVGLSDDGVTFGPRLTEPLYDPAVVWVPGDERVRTFYVRNESDDDARLSIDVLGSTVDSLMDTGDLSVSARGDGGPWQGVSTAGTHRLVSGVDLPSGDVSRVDVEVALDPTSVNSSQRRRLDVDFRVRLVQKPAGVEDAGETVDPPDGLLPDTGGPVTWVVLVAACLIGGGTILTSRRHEKEDSHVQS
ncbi:LPXTG cell wall anchor domain-containing protein [Aeromicrobium stalagmiti]|uniref:LPXTG cell wall anchor domain-containing protein n=1 Tax=Aeromicrobium stalagmiti TaxID=2738988 RepID=UPI001569818C|nr:LPXTG cell wall anchor domain-containing protein [Aeromicrobium stalagmiti]NRQ50535.1 LPXTG cell wall anchor domain-containing protein [Aeromicrobium stalagmiti]